MQRFLLALQTDLSVTQAYQTELSYLQGNQKIVSTYL